MKQEQDYTLEQIIENSFDFSDYSDDEKTELIAETSAMIMEAALLRSLDEAGSEMQDTFNTFIEAEPTEEKMTDFIKNNLPGFGAIVVDEIKVFQEMGKNDTDTKSE